MWAVLSGLISSIASGIVGPVFTYLGKKQDVTLDGFKTASGLDVTAYQAALDHDVKIQQLKLQATNWWGPRVLYMIVGVAAVMHAAAVFLDTTFQFGCGHYGCLAVPKLPPDYADFERMVVGSLFITALAERPITALTTAWLRR